MAEQQPQHQPLPSDEDFEPVDRVLLPWAVARGIAVYKRHWDEYVIRAFDIPNYPRRQRCHVWIEPPSHAGEVVVHVSRVGWERVIDLRCQPTDLAKSLDRAIELANWGRNLWDRIIGI